jgi:hypothetical protein
LSARLRGERGKGEGDVLVEGPGDGDAEDKCLESVLESDAQPVIGDPATGDSLSKGDAQACAEDEHGVGERKRDRVARHELRKGKLEEVAGSLIRANVGAHGEEEEGDPEECEEALPPGEIASQFEAVSLDVDDVP